MSIAPETKLPAIPSVPGDAGLALRDFLTAVKGRLEIYDGTRPNATILDRVITHRDVLNSGLGAINIGGQILSNFGRFSSSSSGLQSGTFVKPPAITGFTASGAIMTIILSWTFAPASAQVAYYEIYRHATDNLGLAVKIGTTPADTYPDPIGATGVTYYYWVRGVSLAVNNTPVFGDFNALNGTPATTGYVTGVNVAPDTTPPGAPSGLMTTGMLKAIVVQWTNPAEYDVSVVEVWSNTVNDRATSTKAGEARGTFYFDRRVGTYYYWVRAVDSQTPPNVGAFNAGVGATGVIGSSVTISGGNATTYMDVASISSALIIELTADKISSGTISSPTIYLGDTTFKLDGPTRLLTIKDQQGTPVTRVRLGKLGPGTGDYGVEVIDSAGAVIIGANGLGLSVVGTTQLQNLAVDDAKVANLNVSKLRTGTLGAYQINVGASQIIIDGADSTIKVFDTQATPVNRIKIGKLGVNPTDYGLEVRTSSGSILIDASGLGLNVVGNANILNLAVDNAKINNVAANKFIAGTIGAQQIYLGGTSFLLDGNTKRLTVSDGTYNRVELGDLGAGAFGVILRNASGTTFLNSGGITSASFSVMSGVATSSQLGVGAGVNQVPNSDFRFDSSRHYFQVENGTVNYGRNLSSAWHPPGEGALFMEQPDGTAVGQAVIWFGTSGATTGFYKVIPGKRYEASAYIGSHRCATEVRISFYDTTGAYISEFSSPQETTAVGGKLLSGYNRLSVFVVAPANAATALPFVRKYATTQGLGYTTSYTFLVRAYFGEAYPNQTEPSPWSGVTTGQFSTLDQINATNISTYMASAAIGNAYITDLSASKITAGTITASISITSPTITGGTITGSVFQTGTTGQRFQLNVGGNNYAEFYDSGNVLRAKMGVATVGSFTSHIYALNTSASSYGVYGKNNATGGVGVYGVCDTVSNGAGIAGDGYNGSRGVAGYSSSDRGVHGTSDTYIGVYGQGNTATTSWDFYAGGSGVNYGPFTGAHDGVVSSDFVAVLGDIVCDRGIVARKNISNTIAKVDYATFPMDATAIGVIVGHSDITDRNMPTALIVKDEAKDSLAEYIEPLADLQAKYKRVAFNAVGEGLINVCNEGGDIQAGDYICTSSVKGKGMKQDDGVCRNYTVARARESASWDNDNDAFKQIACIYLAG